MAKFAVGEVVMVVVIACMLVGSAPWVKATITCLQVTNLLTPCISYGVMGGTVSPECCTGIYELNAAYKTTEDIRKACSCVKDGAAMIPGINYDRINEIPGKCNTTCPYKVYPDTDCSRFVFNLILYTLLIFLYMYVFMILIKFLYMDYDCRVG